MMVIKTSINYECQTKCQSLIPPERSLEAAYFITHLLEIKPPEQRGTLYCSLIPEIMSPLLEF